MFQSLRDVNTYIYNTIKSIDSTNASISLDIVWDLVGDFFWEIVEEQSSHLSDLDKQMLADHAEDAEFCYSLLSQKIPQFYTLVDDMVAQILAAYTSPLLEQE